ncbi:amidohydrolase family protein [Halodesulfovibrio aestuarii]|uniref:Amidohydrolase family protein n=1 Tax=Halodesulfovibrio aestuarii TaxID=126333 RepID=A0ABV4JTQ7_9BACT
MLNAIRARRILPMEGHNTSTRTDSGYYSFPDVIEDGVIVHNSSTIVDVLSFNAFSKKYTLKAEDLGDVTLTPALINCHNHLELAHLKGKATFGEGFETWIDSALPHMATPVTALSLESAVSEMAKTGTAHIADVNGRAPKAVYDAVTAYNLSCHIQFEVFGYNFPNIATGTLCPEDLFSSTAATLPNEAKKRWMTLSGHALYSTSPDALVVAKQWCRSHERYFSIHLSEHLGEDELLTKGTGRFREQLSRRVLPKDFTPPKMRAVPYAKHLGLLDESTLAVHCVHCTQEDINILQESGTTVCLCPRSNELIGVGTAPVRNFLEAGLQLTLGTDSLASNHDLNLWNEARYLRDNFDIPTGALLRMLTIAGAKALGITNELGTLSKGKRFHYAILPEDF